MVSASNAPKTDLKYVCLESHGISRLDPSGCLAASGLGVWFHPAASDRTTNNQIWSIDQWPNLVNLNIGDQIWPNQTDQMLSNKIIIISGF